MTAFFFQEQEARAMKVVTFLLTRNPDAAIAFFRDMMGFSFLGDDGFALVFDLGGNMLRIGKVGEFTPARNTVLGWQVDDIASLVQRYEEKGLRFERYSNMGQDAHGICTFPNGDKVAWFKDPDGNVLSFSQHSSAG
jgi:catechol 2,3-dioxygenase-like lactoylglutathione lyase family enzyme